MSGRKPRPDLRALATPGRSSYTSLMPRGCLTRSLGRAVRRVPGLRRVPVLKLFVAAELALLARDHIMRLDRRERRRLVELARIGRGAPPQPVGRRARGACGADGQNRTAAARRACCPQALAAAPSTTPGLRPSQTALTGCLRVVGLVGHPIAVDRTWPPQWTLASRMPRSRAPLFRDRGRLTWSDRRQGHEWRDNTTSGSSRATEFPAGTTFAMTSRGCALCCALVRLRVATGAQSSGLMGDLLDAGLRVLALHPNQARVGVVAPSVLTTESARRVSTALARHDARRVPDVDSETASGAELQHTAGVAAGRALLPGSPLRAAEIARRRSLPRPTARRAPPSRRPASRRPSSSMFRSVEPGRSGLWRGRPCRA